MIGLIASNVIKGRYNGKVEQGGIHFWPRSKFVTKFFTENLAELKSDNVNIAKAFFEILFCEEHD